MKVNHTGRFTFTGKSVLLLSGVMDSAMLPAQETYCKILCDAK